MPSPLSSPLLVVDAGKMHKVDPGDVETLFGMWTVFSKCAESIEGGKRLENLTWRLWNRHTFCCEARSYPPPPPASLPLKPHLSKKDVPALSSSVGSTDSADISDGTPDLEPCSHRPELSLSRSRGREKHITSLRLEMMVSNIKERSELEPLPPSMSAQLPAILDGTPRPASPGAPTARMAPIDPFPAPSSVPLQHSTDSCRSATTTTTTAAAADGSQKSDHRGSDTSVSSGGLIQSGSIVHGFSPSPISTSLRSQPIPELNTRSPVGEPSTPKDAVAVKKKAGIFFLGGSSGDDEGSFEDRMSKRLMASSLTDRLKQSDPASRPSSFKALLQSRPVRPISERQDEDEEAAIESGDDDDEPDEEDGEEDMVDESAIEEDDDSDWEDSVVGSGKSSVAEDQPDFKRVGSRPTLVSRKSLLTRGLHEPQRAAALAEAAIKSSTMCRSRTASPNGPSVAASVEPDRRRGGGGGGNGVSAAMEPEASRPKPIKSPASRSHLPASSPRTTRRNMLATELTESLRRHLLWERQQKSTTANAVYKRRHTAHQEMAHLQEYPAVSSGPAVSDAGTHAAPPAAPPVSWSQHFDYGPWEYHTKGW